MSGKPLTCLVSMFFTPFLTHSINHPYSQLSQQHRGDVVITGKSIWALSFLSFCPLFIAYTILKRKLTYSHQLGGASREASGGVSVIYSWYYCLTFFTLISHTFIPTVNILPMQNAIFKSGPSIQASSGDVTILTDNSGKVSSD